MKSRMPGQIGAAMTYTWRNGQSLNQGSVPLTMRLARLTSLSFVS